MKVTYQPKTLKDALLPINWIYWLIGLGVMECSSKFFVHAYNLAIFISYLFFISLCFLFLKDVVNKDNNPVFKAIFPIIYFLTYISSMLYVIFSYVYNKNHNSCVADLMDIDISMKVIGVAPSYRWLLLQQIRQLSCFLFLFLAGILMESFESNKAIYNEIRVRRICAMIASNYSILTTAIGAISFAIFNRAMVKSFKNLNNRLESIGTKHADDNNTQMGSLIQIEVILRDKDKLEVLRRIRIIYFRLVGVARRWTKIKTMHTIASTLLCTCLPLHMSYVGYISLTRNNFRVVGLKNMISLMKTLIPTITLHVCLSSTSALMAEAKQTCGILLRYLYPIAYLRQEVKEFSLELIQSPLRLSGGGLFDLDYSLLLMVFTNIVTYLVVLIQNSSATYSYDSQSTFSFTTHNNRSTDPVNCPQ